MATADDPRLDRHALTALAREVAAVLDIGGGEPLLTARQVASRFNVDRGWVYAHADELGVVRLGDGPKPRLRFDPAIVAQRVAVAPGRVVPGRPSGTVRADVSLLPIKRPRRRRRLEAD